jgi:hypothetical protein
MAVELRVHVDEIVAFTGKLDPAVAATPGCANAHDHKVAAKNPRLM